MSKDTLLNPANDIMLEAETLKNMLVSYATGGSGDDSEYKLLRKKLMADPSTKKLLPKCVLTCRDLSEFWGFIKSEFAHYAERREFLREEFDPLLTELEQALFAPAVDDISQTLSEVDSEHVNFAWRKALERKNSDPEGAITAARTLVETVCKHILDENGTEHNDGQDLPKLYRLAAEQLNLAPSQHTEQVFKQILGGCHAIVEGLGSVRNRLSDAHGRSKKSVRPAQRHAELAVNLAGSMATFLVQTQKVRKARDSSEPDYIFDSARLKAELSAIQVKVRGMEKKKVGMVADADMAGPLSALDQELDLLQAETEALRTKLRITELGFTYFEEHSFNVAVEACGMVGRKEKLSEATIKIPAAVVEKFKQARKKNVFGEFYIQSCFELPDDGARPESVLFYLFGSASDTSDIFLIEQWST